MRQAPGAVLGRALALVCALVAATLAVTVVVPGGNLGAVDQGVPAVVLLAVVLLALVRPAATCAPVVAPRREAHRRERGVGACCPARVRVMVVASVQM